MIFLGLLWLAMGTALAGYFVYEGLKALADSIRDAARK